MKKPKEPRLYDPDEQVEVPDADDMDDETFLKHLDKRHAHETGTEQALHQSAHIQAAWVGAYRAFHDYQHRTKPDEHYDHVHVWDEDDDDDDD